MKATFFGVGILVPAGPVALNLAMRGEPPLIFGYQPLRCRPHSFDSGDSHHHLPARMSSPGEMARVQGAQPMLG